MCSHENIVPKLKQERMKFDDFKKWVVIEHKTRGSFEGHEAELAPLFLDGAIDMICNDCGDNVSDMVRTAALSGSR